MQYILLFLSIPFLYLNYRILTSDLKYKKIPNKYLKYLLILIPIFYIYIFLNFPDINYILFLWQIILTFIITFILYNIWVWAAWNAKYLLILTLFIPNIWIIPLIWNIALLAILYLILYFIWFYFWRCLFYKWYAKNLFFNIKHDFSEKWFNYKNKKWWKSFFIILKWLISFLIIFVSIRLFRIYIFNNIFTDGDLNFLLIKELIEKYNIYLIFLVISFFIWIIYVIKLISLKFTKYLVSELKLNIKIIWNIFLIFTSLLLISFIISEFLINPNEISTLLYKIFTLYIVIYIFIKIILFSYKITFVINQAKFINIKDLKKWTIIDKNYLITLFWNQTILWYSDKDSYWKIDTKSEKFILYPNPTKYFKNLNWPLATKDVNIIKKCYELVNKYHIWKINWYTKNVKIKTLNSFSFWLYIFLWFIITYFFWNKIIAFILINIIIFLKELIL
mgnify:CR=1 FL=1|jgi:hypothetical protein